MPDRRTVYIEPSTLAGTGAQLLLAGTPSYIWNSDPSHGTRQLRDSLIGVVIDSIGGIVAGITPPNGLTNLGDIRAIELKPGRWGVGFTTFSKPLAGRATGIATGTWFGSYDGEWSRIERVPLPADATPVFLASSRLVMRAGTIAWAIPVDQQNTTRLALAVRSSTGAWTVDMLPGPAVAAAAITATTEGIVIAMVRPDTTLSSDGNSLFLYTQGRQGWDIRRLQRGGDHPVYDPNVEVLSDSVLVVSWLIDGASGHDAYGVVSTAAGAASAPYLIAGSVTNLHVLEGTARPTWVVTRAVARDRESDIQILELRGNRITAVKSLPYQFEGFYAVRANERSRLVLAGPRRGRDAGDPPIATELIRAQISCDEALR